LGRCHQRHRHQEFLAFLERIDAAFPDDGQSQLHLIIDNYFTHKTPKSIAGCYVIHAFIFTSLPGSSWLNMVERFFAPHHYEAIRREASLRWTTQAAIDAYSRTIREQTFCLDCLCSPSLETQKLLSMGKLLSGH
jgi:putative transposase